VDLDVFVNPFQDLLPLAVVSDGEDSHLWRAFSIELQPRAPANGIRNGHRQLVAAYVVSSQEGSVITLKQANLAVTAAFDASAAGDPIEFLFAAESRSDTVDFRFAPEACSDAVNIRRPPCIFSYFNSSGSTLFVPFQRRGILRLCLLLSLVRFVETNWMMLLVLMKDFGAPCPAPPDTTVLCSHWNYIIKIFGTCKARIL
jgi:hypothetical protein